MTKFAKKNMFFGAKLNDSKPLCENIYEKLMMKLISFSRCKIYKFAQTGSETWKMWANWELETRL